MATMKHNVNEKVRGCEILEKVMSPKLLFISYTSWTVSSEIIFLRKSRLQHILSQEFLEQLHNSVMQ